MKTGKTLEEMAKELTRQKDAKRDFIAPTAELEVMAIDANTLPPPQPHEGENEHAYSLKINGHGTFGIADTAHEQLAQRLGIPQKYYERMKVTAPALLEQNANYWFKKEPEKRLVRTLDGNARAFLSNRYRPLDNAELAEAVLPTLVEAGCTVESSELTERRFYIKAVTERLTFEVKKGDIVQAGLVISNSEIGLGSVKVEPLIYRLSCLNGMISVDASLRKYHVGRGGDAGDLAEEFFRNETRQADDRAFWLKVRDVVNGAFRRDVFERIVARLQIATGLAIPADPVKVVEVVQQKFQLQDAERSGILTHLIKGGDLTQYGLVNAITRTSQDVKDYDRATDLERLGGQVLELPKSDWQAIANAENN